MIAEEACGRSAANILRNGVLAAAVVVATAVGAVAQTTAPMPPVVINSDAAANVPNPSGPPIPKAAVTPPVRPLQSAPPQAQAAVPQPATIADIVAANLETPEKICPAVTPIITAEPGAAFDLIETARQRPKQSEGLAQCLSQIQSAMKSVNPDGAKTIDALVASAPAAFQAAYAVALANAASGDAGSPPGDTGGGSSSSGSGTSSSGGSSSGGGSTGGGTGFSGFAGGGAIGGSGGSGNGGSNCGSVSQSAPC